MIVGFGDDLARCALSLARRFAAGGTLWAASPGTPAHARHLAVEFIHPVGVGARALPAVAVDRDVVATLRALVRRGDVVVAIGEGLDAVAADLLRRGPAWGATTVWLGSGVRPPAGVADHVLWCPSDDPLTAAEEIVRAYHLLWELTHVCFEHPGALRAAETDEVCTTCSDEGTPGEVLAVDGTQAVVRTAAGRTRVDVGLIDPPDAGDLVLLHGGIAIASLDGRP